MQKKRTTTDSGTTHNMSGKDGWVGRIGRKGAQQKFIGGNKQDLH